MGAVIDRAMPTPFPDSLTPQTNNAKADSKSAYTQWHDAPLAIETGKAGRYTGDTMATCVRPDSTPKGEPRATTTWESQPEETGHRRLQLMYVLA